MDTRAALARAIHEPLPLVGPFFCLYLAWENGSGIPLALPVSTGVPVVVPFRNHGGYNLVAKLHL
ncbi:hypothetical protein E2562_032871, partial [Oryza meyeriana var. granulata]